MKAEEAFDLLVSHLSSLTFQKNIHGKRQGPHGADLYLPDLIRDYWHPILSRAGGFIPEIDIISEEKIIPFYDAAWDLCRMGVIRPGSFAPMGQGHPTMFGEHFVVTEFGAKWLKDASQRAFLDPSRLGSTLGAFAGKFGDGYAQRASEAVKTYRNENWLAACVMAGAAAESILLSVAIAKTGNEKKVLTTYGGAGGRSRTTKLVANGITASLQQTFEAALGVVQYWRDDAAYGVATALGETEAHEALTRLLRLAQFTSKNWSKLTARPSA